jgi:medium-chain acyl-[acyl-carrier-protein] hydrolase
MGEGESEQVVDSGPAEQPEMAPNLWLPFASTDTEPALRLFCFPHSGAGVQCFRPWLGAMPTGVALQAIQYPGRENRMKEPALTRMEPLTTAIAEVLLPYLESPYALFGHSMGAMVAFSVCQYLQRHGKALPEHVFLSACLPPQNQALQRSVMDLSDDELLDELREYGQTPEGVLDNAELMNVYLPLVRADFSVIESFRPNPEDALSCPLTVYGGTADSRVKGLRLGDWHAWTTGAFHVELFDGEHFFVYDQQGRFLSSFVQKLSQLAHVKSEGTV